MVVVDVPFHKRFEVKAALSEAYALVSDVYASGMHFPGVDSLVAVDDNGCWRWVLAERGFGPIKLRARYQAVYQCDPSRFRVEWCPAERSGDMESSGSWQLEEGANGGTVLDFEAKTVAKIPAPGMMASMVDSFAKNELLRLKELYVLAIQETLGGA
jgi:carbon monoxide dehydrogenase subunit G